MKDNCSSGGTVSRRPFTDGRVGANLRTDWNWLPFFLAVLALSTVMTSDRAFAQDESAQSLTERSAIVVRGKVLKTNASNEPMVAASSITAIILVHQMYAGSEIAGDQMGRAATVILSRPERLKAGEEALFFGNPRFVGRSLTIADEDEISSKAAISSALTVLERGVQARRDRPVLDRLTTASLVFRGSVETVRALDAGAEQSKPSPAPPSEHDPEWHVATVRVVTPLYGGEAGHVVTVIFPASRDVVWFNAPKLKPDQEAVFITHAPSREDAALYRASGLAAFLDKQPAYLVTEPSDVLPPSDEARVRGLLSRAKETK
jgi:hypothetical protein